MMKLDKKLKVGVLGATGMVGQRFLVLLENHPWFDVVVVAASARSAGQTYEEAVGARWKLEVPMPEKYKDMVVQDMHDIENVAGQVDFVFCAVDMGKEEIRAIEDGYAKTETPVVSNNSAHRWTPDVPMVVPEINPEHFDIIPFQKKRLGTKRGFVAVKPNCSIQSYAPAISAWLKYEPTQVLACTYQAISGAGKTFANWPEMVENVKSEIPMQVIPSTIGSSFLPGLADFGCGADLWIDFFEHKQNTINFPWLWNESSESCAVFQLPAGCLCWVFMNMKQ